MTSAYLLMHRREESDVRRQIAAEECERYANEYKRASETTQSDVNREIFVDRSMACRKVASYIRGELCAEADREAVAEQDFRWQMFGESQHKDNET